MNENDNPPMIPAYGPPAQVMLADPSHQKPLNKLINFMLKPKPKLHNPFKNRTRIKRKKVKFY